MLSQRVGFQRERVPLVLEDGEEGGDGGQGGRAWADSAGGFQVDEVGGGEVFAGDGIFAVLRDVGFYETFFEDVALDGMLAMQRYNNESGFDLGVPDFAEATGTWGLSPDTTRNQHLNVGRES